MKQAEFRKELDKRLGENRKLTEHPGWGKSAEGVSSYVGLHFFWVLIILSLIVSFIWVNDVSLEKMGNNFLFGWLYE
jgi:hypothetical protein